jgi:hypothetical protein
MDMVDDGIISPVSSADQSGSTGTSNIGVQDNLDDIYESDGAHAERSHPPNVTAPGAQAPSWFDDLEAIVTADPSDGLAAVTHLADDTHPTDKHSGYPHANVTTPAIEASPWFNDFEATVEADSGDGSANETHPADKHPVASAIEVPAWVDDFDAPVEPHGGDGLASDGTSGSSSSDIALSAAA